MGCHLWGRTESDTTEVTQQQQQRRSWASQAALVVKNPPVNAGGMICAFDPWVRKIPWRRKWQPSPVFLPGKSHGQRSLVGYSPQGCKKLDMTEASQHSTTHIHSKTHIQIEIECKISCIVMTRKNMRESQRSITNGKNSQKQKYFQIMCACLEILACK